MEMKERGRKEILAGNILDYLAVNHMTEKEAAEKAGIKVTTLNSWIRMVSYPREPHLKRLADMFGIPVEALTEDQSPAALRRRKYMTVGESLLLKQFREDELFREYVQLGLDTSRNRRLLPYIKAIRDIRS